MTRFRRLPVVLGILAAVCAAIGVWLVLDNPTVKSTSLGAYTCTAPYDTVLNDPDNVPGGEPPPDADEVEARCIAAGETRFTQGLFAGGAAVLLAAIAAALAVRGRTT
jgi:hypothetical protein